MLKKFQIFQPIYIIYQLFLYSCDVTSFSSETQNKNNQGKYRGLFISRHRLSAQPYLKQPSFESETLQLITKIFYDAKTFYTIGLVHIFFVRNFQNFVTGRSKLSFRSKFDNGRIQGILTEGEGSVPLTSSLRQLVFVKKQIMLST